MALTIASVKQELEDRNFPCILTEKNYNAIVQATLRRLNRYEPILCVASFTTLETVQDYAVFDTTDTVTGGICDGATSIREVYWNPGGDWSSLNVFSPGWTMLSSVLLYTGSYFHHPSQMMVLRQKLDAWKTQFGSQGFEIVSGHIGHPDARLRIHPIPQTSDNKVLVEFVKGVVLEDLPAGMEEQFYEWAYFFTAEALANVYSTTAGVELLNFTDSKEAMGYWRDKAKEFYEIALNSQGGIQGGSVIRG